MKYCVCITLLITFFSCHHSISQQSSQLATLKFQELSLGIKGTCQDIYPGPQGSSYVLTSHMKSTSTAWSKQKVKFTKFDSSFAFVENIEYDDVFFNPNLTNGGLAFCNDSKMNLHLIWFEKTKESVTLYSKMIEGPSISNKLVEIAKEKGQKVKELTVESSPNGLYSVIYFSFPEKKSGRETHIIVLDENTKFLQNYTRKTDLDLADEQISVSDNGHVGHIYITVENQSKKDLNLYDFDLTLFGNGEILGSYSRLDNPAESISSYLTFAKDKMFFEALFRTTKEKRVKSKKGKKSKFKKRPYYTLHQSIFDSHDLSLISYSENNLSQSKTDKAIEGGAENIILRNCLIMKDGSALVLTEAVLDRAGGPGFRFSNRGFDRNYKLAIGFYMDILAIHIGTNGDLVKTKMINKQQLGASFWLFSFNPVKIQDDYYIVYLDKKRITKLIRFSLDENAGLNIKSQNFSKDKMTKRGIVQNTLSCGRNNEIYAVINYPRKKVKLVKFDLVQD